MKMNNYNWGITVLLIKHRENTGSSNLRFIENEHVTIENNKASK